MTRIEELSAQKTTLIQKAQALLKENKIEEAKKVKDEIELIVDEIDLQEFLDKETLNKDTHTPVNKQTKESASFVRAAIKKFSGKTLTEAENALLLPTVSAPNGASGEGYIIPKDIRTSIIEKIRDYGSLRDVVDVVEVSSTDGSFAVENFESLTGLVEFADGTPVGDVSDISFTNVKFVLTEHAAFISLSNTLLKLSNTALIEYISKIFARKAVISENAAIIAALKNGKTAKSLADYIVLRKSMRTDIDPAAGVNMQIVTNQDGFAYLENLRDERGKPLMTPDITEAGKFRFLGAPIKMVSNATLPSSEDGTTAPIFYGDTKSGVKLLNLGAYSFAASEHAGFMANTTLARLIAFFAAKQFDGSDKCYCYGELNIAETSDSEESKEVIAETSDSEESKEVEG